MRSIVIVPHPFEFHPESKPEDLVKSPKGLFSVIPVETGIQSFQCLANTLDFRLRGNDDSLRKHHICLMIVQKVTKSTPFPFVQVRSDLGNEKPG
jgi:hypothetical protein